MRDFAAIDFETANSERTSVCSVGVDCHSFHNGNNTFFLLASVHIEQHLKCTSRNPILFG